MDALILSCGTGGGHNSAGRAIQEELCARGHRVRMLNPYTLQSDALAGRIDRLYVRTAQRAPRAFGAIYRAGELYRKLPLRSPVYYANRGMLGAMEDYLRENRFDIIIMPHLFPAEILTNMKRRGLKVPKTMFVATDYCCIPFTEETDCDAYVIPSADLRQEYAVRGIPEERLYPLGIPVGRSFEELRNIIDRVERKDRLGGCLDTCHVFSAGYDIVHNLDGVLEEFDRILGLELLKAIHLNDSLMPFGSHKDRHATIGDGEIGMEALLGVLAHPRLKGLPFYLETPLDDAGHKEEIRRIRESLGG